jgi:hypothetical protein
MEQAIDTADEGVRFSLLLLRLAVAKRAAGQ